MIINTHLQPVCCDGHDVGKKEGELKAAHRSSLAGSILLAIDGIVATLSSFSVLRP